MITGEPLKLIYDGVYPFLAVLVAALVILFIFPEAVTFLQDLVMGKG
jgi:TRAP-type mannitol/chloroaromatic compound transport system permease large subunit